MRLKIIKKILKFLKRCSNAKPKGLHARSGFLCITRRSLQKLLDTAGSFDVVQLPYSVFDRRFETFFSVLSCMNIEVHARSVFLQGAAFIAPEQLPEHLRAAKSQWSMLYALAKKNEISINALCLNFALHQDLINRIVVGVDSLEHFKLNVADLEKFETVRRLKDQLQAIVITDEHILLPSLWKK